MFFTLFFTLFPMVAALASPIEPAAFHDRKDWFAAFLKNTDQKEVQKRATLITLQEHFPHLWERIQDSNYQFTSVFVGAGSGGTEIPLMKEFVKARNNSANFTTYCEDPSPHMMDEFFSAAKGDIADQIVEYILLSFEDPAYDPPQADLALASHVWYFIQDWKGVEKERNTLVKFASILSQRSGAGIITLQSKTSDRYSLNADCAVMRGVDEELVAEKIVDELQRLGINFKNPLKSHSAASETDRLVVKRLHVGLLLATPPYCAIDCDTDNGVHDQCL